MKNLKTPLAVLAVILTMSSCRKQNEEIMAPALSAETESIATTAAADSLGSAWSQSSEWTEVKQPTHTVYYTHLKAEISESNADNALIRVFSQTAGKGAKSLPFEETVGSSKYYWYYTVTEGDIMVAVDVYGDAANPGTKNAFKYLVLDEKAIAQYEADGVSKADLVDLSLDKLAGK